ncbi:MAG: tetratricopeptide repeat protein [Candidatus Omnitrophica bacterium]|nr:tetratricopeptide repeat protein [Candidatus Omnitrophota bacterium]
MNKKRFSVFLLFFLYFLPPVEANPVKEKFESATMAYSMGHYQDAIALYEEVIKLYPKLPQAYFFMGMAHRNLGTKLEDIIWLFEKAIELNPQYAEAHESLGKIYYELGKFDEAKEQCLKALEIQPDNIFATLSLGWIYLLGKSDPSSAIPYFEQAIKNNNPPYAYFGLGMSYVMTNSRAKTLEMITYLRLNDQEVLAQQLETMLRENKIYRPDQPGVPLVSSPEPIEEETDPSIPTLTGNSTVEKMPVRLSGKLPNGEVNNDVNTNPPEQNIQALKRRTQRYSRGSDY